MSLLSTVALVLALLGLANSQCQQSCGAYSASWQADQAGANVKFTITYTPSTPGQFWTGIGFGKQMNGGDFVVITANSTGGEITDRFGTGHSSPKVDEHNDVKDGQVQIVGGKMVATFVRAVKTGDKNDVELIDPAGDCQCFMLPLVAGTVGPNAELEAHQKIPLRISVCNITQCHGENSNGGTVVLDNCKLPGPNPTQCDGAPAGGPQEGAGAPKAAGAGVHSEGQNATESGRNPGASAVPQGGPNSGPINSAQSGAERPNGAGNPTGERPIGGGNAGAERPPLGAGRPENGGLSQGGAETVPQSTVSCQLPVDNAECNPYIDRYWLQIFKTQNPPLTHQYRKQACTNLIVHQKGQVRRECCNYLKQKCGDFMTNQDNLGSPTDNGSTGPAGQPQPTQAGVNTTPLGRGADPNTLPNGEGRNGPQTGPNGQPVRGGSETAGSEVPRGQAGPDGQGKPTQGGSEGRPNQGGPDGQPNQGGPEGKTGPGGPEGRTGAGGAEGRPGPGGPDGQRGPVEGRGGFPQNPNGPKPNGNQNGPQGGAGEGPNGQNPAGVTPQSGPNGGQSQPDRNGPNPTGQTGQQGGFGGPQGGQGSFGGQNGPQGGGAQGDGNGQFGGPQHNGPKPSLP